MEFCLLVVGLRKFVYRNRTAVSIRYKRIGWIGFFFYFFILQYNVKNNNNNFIGRTRIFYYSLKLLF